VKKKLLFVTYKDETQDEGLSYAIDLAKTLEKGITILLVSKKKLEQRFEDIMAAVAFAEEGEHETAREIERGNNSGGHEKQMRVMLE
jgi:hypothetical protein